MDAPSEEIYAKFYDVDNSQSLTHTYTYRSVNGWDGANHHRWTLLRITESGTLGWQRYQASYANEIRDFRHHVHAIYAPLDRPTIRVGLGHSKVGDTHTSGPDWTYVYLGRGTPNGIMVYGHRNGVPCWHLIP